MQTVVLILSRNLCSGRPYHSFKSQFLERKFSSYLFFGRGEEGVEIFAQDVSFLCKYLSFQNMYIYTEGLVVYLSFGFI